MSAAVQIAKDGPLGRPYPVVEIDGVKLHRRFGSWLVETAAGLREPVVFGVDPADLQSLPAVRAFDRERRSAAAVAPASFACPHGGPACGTCKLAGACVQQVEPPREWAKGDRVMWAGSKARVLGPGREPGKIRIKANRKVHHVSPSSLTERKR